MDQVYGYIERITFHNEENGYTVAQLKQPKHSQLTCIVGSMPGLQPGETIRCYGEWKTHLVHGKQFEVTRFQVEAPSDVVGIQKYLGSGLIKGIGHKYAQRIVDCFGSDTLNVIDASPERLNEIEGLGPKRIHSILSCWSEQKSIREVMVFLQSHSVSPSFAQKIFKAYGSQSIHKVTENPFLLARDIVGIGFKSADHIAFKLGIEKNSAKRIDAGIEYVLKELSGDGHVCFPLDEFLIESQKTLENDLELINQRILALKNEDRIHVEDLIVEGQPLTFLWTKPLFLSEVGIAREICRLIANKSLLREIDTDKALSWVQTELKITLAENQKTAIAQSVTGKLHIITGGPGTGKSTITNAILTITGKLTSKIFLVAPTGRAAKRMSEITKHKASTIHSLLEFDFKNGGFKRKRDNPLDCDLIIIDEASMIDTYLMYGLLKAIPDHCRVVFVGDINQLPSVGPGNVLNDMIASHCIPVTTLNQIFRQAAGSHIIKNAHRINQGIYPTIWNGSDSDFFFLEREEADDVYHTIVNLVTQRLPKKYGFNPLDQIQVLAPMKKGIIGTESLNQALQLALNPKEMSLTRGGQKFQEGDKVMQTRNDYQKEVFNGDIGYIQNIDPEDQQLVIRFDDRDVIYNYSDLDELMLGYAISVHKFQGSECPCVVIPVHTSHYMMLHRNLLYTGVTRGKKLVVLVGTPKALSIAVKNNDVQKRYTSLQQALINQLL